MSMKKGLWKKMFVGVSLSAMLISGFPQIADAQTHKVQKGDTLWGLSKKYDATVAELRQWNHLSSDLIRVGQTLHVSTPDKNTSNSSKSSAKDNSSNQKQVQGFVYTDKIPMPYKQQEYLYKLTKQRGLDYKETLAVIMLESTFRPNVVASNNYGYFQVNKVNHPRLAKTLGTKNAPLDPYVNMNWGTFMLAELKKKFQKQGLKGTALKEAMLSAYNRGEGGYKKYGKATHYINKHNQSLAKINKMFS